MGFEPLLGNGQLKENLRTGVGRGRVSHFYLICGPQGAGKKTLARLLAAAILCKEADKPCLRCNACRKGAARMLCRGGNVRHLGDITKIHGGEIEESIEKGKKNAAREWNRRVT